MNQYKAAKSINRQLGYYLFLRVVESISLKLQINGYLPEELGFN